MAPEVRYWTNETGTAHIVEEWNEHAPSPHSCTIKTACGMEYLTVSAGQTFDPDLSSMEQTNDPRGQQTRYCERCPWDQVIEVGPARP